MLYFLLVCLGIRLSGIFIDLILGVLLMLSSDKVRDGFWKEEGFEMRKGLLDQLGDLVLISCVFYLLHTHLYGD